MTDRNSRDHDRRDHDNDWQVLPDGVGTVLAVAGGAFVAAQSGRLRAWRGHTPLWLAEVADANPARPTILTERVLWGPYAVATPSGDVTEIAYARPPAEYLQTAHAWSADGSVAIAAGRRQDAGGTGSYAAAWLLTPDGRVPLWSADDVPPTAVFVDRDLVIVGHRDPGVYATDGLLLRSLATATPPQRIDARDGRILLVEAGCLSAWDRSDGTLLGRAEGGWMDGCLTPDGEMVLAADLTGHLVRLAVDAALSDPVVEALDDPLTGVATDGSVLLGAFAYPPGLRFRSLSPRRPADG